MNLSSMSPKIVGQRTDKKGILQQIAHWKCPGCDHPFVELHRRGGEAIFALGKRAEIHIKQCTAWMHIRDGYGSKVEAE